MMGIENEWPDGLPKFSGKAPLFPLPSTVLFPHELLPLHFFEPRYRQMVDDALAGDRLIAVALLRPGWEANYEDKTTAIHPTVCVSRITMEQRLPDGRFNVVVQGLSRAIVLNEHVDDLPYRQAELELQPDRYAREPMIDRQHREHELLAAFRELFPGIDLDHVLYQAIDAGLPLGMICDVLAAAMRLEPTVGQEVLEEADVDRRSDLLLIQLKRNLRAMRNQPATSTFPPPFSNN